VIKAKWEPGYKVFSHENGLKFSKNVGIFPEMRVSLSKSSSHFYVGLLMQRSLKLSLG